MGVSRSMAWAGQQGPLQEVEGADVGGPGRCRNVVARVDIAVAAVAGVVDMQLRVWMRATVRLDVRWRNAVVAGAEVEQHRRAQRFAQDGQGARAVVADRGQ